MTLYNSSQISHHNLDLHTNKRRSDHCFTVILFVNLLARSPDSEELFYCRLFYEEGLAKELHSQTGGTDGGKCL
jgi:hypothetical protein